LKPYAAWVTGLKHRGTQRSKNQRLYMKKEEINAEGPGLEAILNSMFEGVIALDSCLNIILVNRRFCSLFGVDLIPAVKDWRGTSMLELSRSAEMEEAARQVLSTGRPTELNLRRYASGIEQNFQVFIAPLEPGSVPEQETNNEVMCRGVVIVVRDISRLVKLEQVRKNFAANVSHELRTPIQVVKGFAENILDSSMKDKKQIRHFAEIIRKNARIMENITNDLLTLVSLEDESSAVQGSNPRPPMEETEVAPLIAEAKEMVEIAARKKNISIDVFCPPDLSAKLYGSLIIQALVNLLDNGIKYSDSRIKVYAFRDNNEIIIEVKDKGIGIPAEHLSRIFERFYRVDRARSRDTGIESKAGTGLGLAIVRHIALLHNGKAEVESHAGEGSVFRLRLPRG